MWILKTNWPRIVNSAGKGGVMVEDFHSVYKEGFCWEVANEIVDATIILILLLDWAAVVLGYNSMNEVNPNETWNRIGSSLLSTSLRFDFMNLLRRMVLAILFESKLRSEKNIFKNLFLWILQVDSTFYDRKHQSINLPMRFPQNLHPLNKNQEHPATYQGDFFGVKKVNKIS